MGRLKETDLAGEELKLSAGHVTRKRANGEYVETGHTAKDLFSSMIDVDFIPSGRYIISCHADCDYQSGNENIDEKPCPAGFCTFTSGRCAYDNKRELPKGIDTRVILEADYV